MCFSFGKCSAAGPPLGFRLPFFWAQDLASFREEYQKVRGHGILDAQEVASSRCHDTRWSGPFKGTKLDAARRVKPAQETQSEGF